MTVYSVNYDLRIKKNPDYEGLYEEIKRCPAWWHHLESTWLIATDETPEQVYNRLAPHMHRDDSILVIEVTNNYSGWLPPKASEWLRQYVPVSV